MTRDIPQHMLAELSRLVAVHTGLHFPEKKYPSLAKTMTSVVRDLGTDIHQLVQSLYASPPQEIMDALTTRLTVGETYFLRDKNFFQILQDHILRGITQHPKRHSKKIVFWSAACATGEEPYSIAIMMDQMLPALRGWEIIILGSDINPAALTKAKKGIYSNWSLRGTPEKIIKTYFTPLTGNYFALTPRIKQMVKFQKVNLMADHYRPLLDFYDTIDIILCCNVLMYIEDTARNRVLRKLSGLLVDNGWLVTGPAESGFVNRPEFSPVRFPSALYHRKGPPRQMPETAPIKTRSRKPEERPYFRTTSEKTPSPKGKLARRITDKTPSRRAPETPKHDRYQEAVDDYNHGDYFRATEKLLTLFSENHSNPPGFLMKTESMILLAKSYANMGQLAPAREWCEKAIDTEKLNPEIYYLLSTILQSDRKIDEALKALKQSIYLDPEFIMAHFTLGMLQLQKDMAPEGRKSLQNALALLNMRDPEDIPPFSEGMTTGRLIETLKSMQINEA